MRPGLLLTATLLSVVGVACSGGDESSDQSAAATTTVVGAVSSADEAPIPAGVLTDVRVGHHEGYERVTLEFTGVEPPEYRDEQADQPETYECSPLDVPGSSFINIDVPYLAMGDPARPVPGAFEVDRAVAIPEATRVTQVRVTCDFEGRLYLTIGLNDGYPYSISVLRDPARLVIDIDAEPATPAPAPP